MKKTPLYELHLAAGAKMVEFAGYQMPVSYVGIVEEHHAVRKSAGIFDVSHMGEFILKGSKALDLIQSLTTNDASKLKIGDAQYSCLPNGKGGIVDDLLVYRLAEDNCSAGEQAFMLVVNASNMQKDWDWLSSHNSFGDEARLTDISEQTALLAVQGAKTAEILQHLTDIDLKSMRYYTFQKGRFAGVDNVIISATGYTGAGGFELYVKNEDAIMVWNAVIEAGKSVDLQPIGLGARDTLRLEMGYCLYGNDIDDTTSPIEAGLGWITKFNKVDFTDKNLLETHKKNGTNRRLVGLEILDKRPARHDYIVVTANDEPIGKVTSGTKSPTLDKNIAMAYIATEHTQIGNTVFIDIRGKKAEAKIVKMPFLTV
jgi:aminomethyltransferase